MSDRSAAPLDRSRPPAPGALRTFDFPPIERARLANGIEVVAARSTELPVVTFNVLVDAGGIREEEERAGLATLTAELLESGAGARGADDIAERIEGLGADVDTSASWDTAYVGVNALASSIEPALEVAAELLRAPTFPLDEVERLRDERLADLLQRRASPRGLANEMALRFVYAERSPYGRGLSGTEHTVAGITRTDVEHFHAANYVGGGARIVVAGSLGIDEAVRLAEHHFGDWTGAATRDRPAPAAEPRHELPVVAIVDRPGSVQSELRVGHLGVERATPDYFALVVMNSILGGAFSSRLNLNLRERQGFTYGISSGFTMRRAPGPFLVSTAVQTEVTLAAVREIVHELRAIRDGEVTPAELDDARAYLAGVFPLRLQTTQGVASRLVEMVVHELPDDYFDGYRARILGVDAAAVRDAAQRYLAPDRLAVVVVGDAAQLRGPLAELELGPVRVFDTEGNETT